MMIRELINSVNTFGVKVVFDDIDKVKESVYKGNHIIYFTPVEGEERKKFERMYTKEKFVSTTFCIHIPDLPISDIIDMYKNCDGSGIYDFICKMILEKCGNIQNMNDAFVIFLFLHEVGHWNQFTEMQCNVKTFIEMDINLEKANFEKVKELENKRQERIKKGSTCLQSAKERKLSESYMKEYRNIPKEKKADDFALANIEKALLLFKGKRQILRLG